MTEMMTLIRLLRAACIPYEVRECLGTPQVCYPSADHLVCNVVCHSGSYGYEAGLLEIMGLVEEDGDDVEGWLTAEEVARRMIHHYKTN